MVVEVVSFRGQRRQMGMGGSQQQCFGCYRCVGCYEVWNSKLVEEQYDWLLNLVGGRVAGYRPPYRVKTAVLRRRFAVLQMDHSSGIEQFGIVDHEKSLIRRSCLPEY